MNEQTPVKEKSPRVQQPASRTEILEAISPYLSDGPSGLRAVIGTSNITLSREGRKFEAARGASIDSLIDASVELTGPLTEVELQEALKPYEEKGITMKIADNSVFFTRGAHIETFATPKDKAGNSSLRQVRMRSRTIMSSLDAPLAHIVRVLNELASGGEAFED